MPAKEKVPRKSYLLPVFFALLRPPGSASTVPADPRLGGKSAPSSQWNLSFGIPVQEAVESAQQIQRELGGAKLLTPPSKANLLQ